MTENLKCVSISAKIGSGILKLLTAIEEAYFAKSKLVTFTFSHSDQAELSRLYSYCNVENVEYTGNEIKVTAIADEKCRGMFSRYLPDAYKPKREDET